MSLKHATRLPVSTYRVQLNAAFGFENLAALVPYLASLGISDVYCSPIFAAAPGSTHGYDVSDYRALNPELGGEEGFAILTAALRQHGMGLLLDFVPNHMGINGPFNAWWRDVLENGRESPHAAFFDIHWNAHRGNDRILVPVLEDHYGIVLENGALQLRQDESGFQIAHGETLFPLRPASYPDILRKASVFAPENSEVRARLHELADAFALLASSANGSDEEKKKNAADLRDLKRRLHELITGAPEAASCFAEYIQQLNGRPGEPASFDALDALLGEQYYRLARWKTGAHETNYRRFFAVDTLVGLRMERDEVFSKSHHRLAQLVRDGLVTGLRIDHIDGLWDPERYLGHLQEIVRTDSAAAPLYVLVEKIVEGEERLPARWLAHGTTGYEFAAGLAQLMTDARSHARFDSIYTSFVGDPASVEETIYASKRLVLEEMFANAINNLAHDLDDLLSEDRHLRDLTRHELTLAIREIIAHLPVYRTYRRFGDATSPEDFQVIEAARTAAIRRNSRLDAEAFDVVANILKGNYPPPGVPDAYRDRVLGWTMSFQQYTGAVMAKAVEDTAFYVHNRLIAINEVGGDPTAFGRPPEDFHRACQSRHQHSPHTQLTTSTHDTKLSEDARARVLVLSEVPEEWEAWLRDWRDLNAPHKTLIDGRFAPDANEEYRIYQTLLAVWPLDDEITDAFRERLRENLRKAVSEAKRNTTWIHPNEPWLAAGDRFVDALLDSQRSRAFLARFRAVAGRLARLGMINSLTQVTLKITTPGIPDFYQGNELFDYSLVDPDNRRPVDFEQRVTLASGLDHASWRSLLAGWRNGALKQRLTRDLLRFRASSPLLFQEGDYRPLHVNGRFAEHVLAFQRQHASGAVVVIVPRLTARIGCPPLGLVWDDTAVVVDGEAGDWTDVLTGKKHVLQSTAPLAALLEELPLAVLHRAPSP